MCFGGNPGPQAMNMPAPIKARNPDLAQESQLAKPKKVVEEGKVTGVQYGNERKSDPNAQGKAVSTDALRIKLNTGTQSAAGNTGGVNV